MKNIQKTNEICYCLGGEISPPKGPEKKTLLLWLFHKCMSQVQGTNCMRKTVTLERFCLY